MTISTPVIFGPEERPLFGWVHQPDGGLQRGTAILCPPVAREYISTHETYRVLAEALAERGITAIRFDYDGTGDSAGCDGDPDRRDDYLGSIGHAIDLADQLGTTELALVGMRMGALLAALAAAACPRVNSLVLWDPCASGRDFVREQSALFRLAYGRSHPENGGTEIPGFVLTAPSVENLTSIVAPTSLPHVERALVLNRPDRPPAGTFGVDEDRVESGVAQGQAELMDVEPFFNKLPGSIAFVTDWLDGALPTERGPQAVPEGRDSMDLTNPAGVPVTERLVRLGPHGLFGIMTTGQTEPKGPPVLFLNSGRDPHSGPNRLWVDLARSWAGLGFPCIRFDLSGLGDSPVRPGQAMHVVRPPEAFDDVADVVGEVASEDPGSGLTSVVLVGLCSGAYQALESGLDLRPRAVVAINPLLRFEPPESRTGPVDPRRRFCLPAGALRRTYQNLPSWKVLRLARKGYLAATTRLRPGHRSGIYWLNELSTQGTDVLCVCGEAEASAFYEGEKSSADQSLTNRGPGIDLIYGLDHGLIVAQQRSDVVERLTEYVVAHHLGDAEPERPPSSVAL